MYRTHHHDLGGNPTSQTEPTKSVRCVVGSGKRVWISAPPTDLESVGNAPCAETCYPDSSELLPRFRNAVHHQKLHDKTGPTRSWHCHGMRHLTRPLHIGYSGHSQSSGAMYSGGARRRGSAHAPNQGIYGRHHPHHEQKAGDAKSYKQSKRPARVVQNGVQAREVQKPRPNKR